VIFVTSHSDFDSRTKATEVGGHDLIGKPFLSFEIIVKALTLILRAGGPRQDSFKVLTSNSTETSNSRLQKDDQPKQANVGRVMV
jgi:DNA-binding response OmpR family regulator